MKTIIVLAQLSYECLGNYSPACDIQRQMQAQERLNQQRHNEQMLEMRRRQGPLDWGPAVPDFCVDFGDPRRCKR